MLPQVMLIAVVFIIADSLPARQQRLSLAQYGSYNFQDHKGPGTYAFGYDIEDPLTDNVQFRQEERHRNGSVTGSYGYVQPDGHVRIMYYIADHLGYRVHEEIQPPLHLHPHHEPPSQVITSTAVPPVHEHDEPIFEGEFYPQGELDNSLDDDSSNNLNGFLTNPHPVQFPPTKFPAPVFIENFSGPKPSLVKQPARTLLGPKNDGTPSRLTYPNVISKLGYVNNKEVYDPSFQNFLTENNVVKGKSRSPLLLYSDPSGQYRGSVKFRLRN